MFDSPLYITDFLESLFSYGTVAIYLVLFLACFVENLFPPFPGDTFIIAAGGLIGLQRLSIVETYLAIIGGGMLSVLILYFWGKSYGRDFFMKKNYKYFSSADIIKIEKQFIKRGALILTFSRFIVGIRSALAVVAGIGRVPLPKMILFSLLSYFLFSSLLLFVSYKLVEHSDLVVKYFSAYNYVIIPILIISLFVLIYKKRRDRQTTDGTKT